ncbi:MAG: tRNA (N(6)-L-threonylcarbamoyladenosine(37)-C(2))-methylthiotransferase MtaB [Sphaerochaetaceae bacterium]|jgi:threonylcarbamoyladenosine tRNA methylthiotransferase MtaB
MKICVYTLGCRLNQCESEAIADAFSKRGYAIVPDGQPADLYIVNTCTVTSKAEQKARRMIRKYAAEPQAQAVVVTGCYAQLDADQISILADRVVVLPLDKKANLLDFPEFLSVRLSEGFSPLEACRAFAGLDGDALSALHVGSGGNLTGQGEPSPFDYDAASFSYHCRAYLKIQDGCDNACAFCRVHVARGAAISLDGDEVVGRALALEREGFHEIVLTGVNLTMYDHRADGLGGLLRKLLAALGSDVRIRLSSLEPDHVDDRLLDQLTDPRMQPHFHVPVQSASDVVLARVNRRYDVEHLSHVIERMRQVKVDPFIAADVIAGLPAEGDAEFRETCEFFVRNQFAQMHVFPFSPRPDTPLFHATDRVPESVRDQRATVLRDLSARLHSEYVGRQGGRQLEAILEQRKKGSWYALTGNYLKVRLLDVPPLSSPGELVRVVMDPVGAGQVLPIARFIG